MLLFRIQGIKITLQLEQVFMENLLSAWLWDDGHVCCAGRGRQRVQAGYGQGTGRLGGHRDVRKRRQRRRKAEMPKLRQAVISCPLFLSFPPQF